MEYKDPEISVIVPAYNAGKYILDMLNSLLKQSVQNFEIIIIDDGSKDNTLDVCKRIAGQDKRVVVLSQKNMGPSLARNKGLEYAKGKYIAFADADDECEPQWLEKMLDAIQQKNCDLVMCNWVKVDYEGTEIYDEFPETLNFVDPVQFVSLLHGLGGAVWNKLFLKDIIEKNKIRFDPLKVRSEDFAFILEYLIYVKQIALVHEPLYRYRIIDQSLSHISDKGKLYLEICEGQYDALKKVKQKACAQLYGSLVKYVVDTNINCLIYIIRNKADAFYIQKMKMLLKNHVHCMNKKQKIYYSIINVSPTLFELSWTICFQIKRKKLHVLK